MVVKMLVVVKVGVLLALLVVKVLLMRLVLPVVLVLLVLHLGMLVHLGMLLVRFPRGKLRVHAAVWLVPHLGLAPLGLIKSPARLWQL